MDRRDFAAMVGDRRFPATFDEAKHVFVFFEEEDEQEPVEVRAKFEVCDICDGRGEHVNPGVDAHGISAEEFERDWSPEEREGYFRGDHNVPCARCKGLRVTPVPDLGSVVDEPIRKRIQKAIRSHNQDLREQAYEIERGC